MVVHQKNLEITGAGSRPITLDIMYNNEKASPVVIYAHGFNGFKDWGNFDLISQQFAGAGFAFIKFNFSHNGTTPEKPEEFADLEAFGNNNYTKQLDDLQAVIDWAASSQNPYAPILQMDNLFLIGHSLGGGIVLVKAAEEIKVRAVATWAAVATLTTPWTNWSKEKIAEWKKKGVAYYVNSRTHQNMPLYYQLYEDYQKNSERLDVLKAVEKLDIPLLVCHGSHDEAVPQEAAMKICERSKRSRILILETDHVFGRKHPWQENYLPAAMQTVTDKTILFFKENKKE